MSKKPGLLFLFRRETGEIICGFSYPQAEMRTFYLFAAGLRTFFFFAGFFASSAFFASCSETYERTAFSPHFVFAFASLATLAEAFARAADFASPVFPSILSDFTMRSTTSRSIFGFIPSGTFLEFALFGSFANAEALEISNAAAYGSSEFFTFFFVGTFFLVVGEVETLPVPTAEPVLVVVGCDVGAVYPPPPPPPPPEDVRTSAFFEVTVNVAETPHTVKVADTLASAFAEDWTFTRTLSPDDTLDVPLTNAPLFTE